MKKLSKLISESAPGAPHLANHRTPVYNIIVMLKAFTARLGITISPLEDYGILIQSTKFNTRKGLSDVLMNSYLDDRAVYPLSVSAYVHQCGLSMYVVKKSQSQVDVVCQPDDTGLQAPGPTLAEYLGY